MSFHNTETNAQTIHTHHIGVSEKFLEPRGPRFNPKYSHYSFISLENLQTSEMVNWWLIIFP